jgi:hypothetical protein
MKSCVANRRFAAKKKNNTVTMVNPQESRSVGRDTVWGMALVSAAHAPPGTAIGPIRTC